MFSTLKKSITQTKIRSHIKDISIVALVLILFVLFLTNRKLLTSEFYVYGGILIICLFVVIGYFYIQKAQDLSMDLVQLLDVAHDKFEPYIGTGGYLPKFENLEAKKQGDRMEVYDNDKDEILTFEGNKFVGKINQDFKTRDRELFDRSVQKKHDPELAELKAKEDIINELVTGEE